MLFYWHFGHAYSLQLQGKTEVCIHFEGEDEGSVFL
jgi:hypothetical protein